MKITRIRRLKGYRLFRDFAWPDDLPPFAQFNLIYGWNGTGKTSLAALFRNLQNKSSPAAGDAVVEIDDTPVSCSEIPNAALPQVRVFDREFVAATVMASGGAIAPIYFFGEESVEKQRRVEELKKELSQADADVSTAELQRNAADKALDNFSIARAKVIKEILIGSRSATYNNYDKRRFGQAIEQMAPESRQANLLADDEKVRLRAQKDAQPKAALLPIACDVPDFAELAMRTASLLGRSVVSQVISALASDREVGAWVRHGLGLHSGIRSSVECRFCGQALPPARIAALEAHFNDDFARFQSDVDRLSAQVEVLKSQLAGVKAPESSRLYDHLAGELEVAWATLHELLKHAVAYVASLHALLQAKRESPFAAAQFVTGATPDRSAIMAALAALNEVIEKHNSMTVRFQGEVDAACRRLERCYVAEAYDEFVRLRNAATTAGQSVNAAETRSAGLREQVLVIERDIVEHRRPAEQLNAELRAYLGRGELQFEVKDGGYAIVRDGQTASDLSEGEKTAIAFLYFLKSLEDKTFDCANGVVVIDDPVSSLDANALFAAFGYMRDRTKGAGQLIVLTHNFSFFRQVKNWYRHLNRGKSQAKQPARLYSLLVTVHDGYRGAELAPIDPLLGNYESEYHYLFKRVFEECQRTDNGRKLESSYGMPNMARRLVEAFLTFRFPHINGLYSQLEAACFDPARKARIRRFLDTHSHHEHVPEPDHDLTVLWETGAILGDVLALIEAIDPGHFQGMKALVGGLPEETADA